MGDPVKQSINVFVVESVSANMLAGDGKAYRLLSEARAGAQDRARAGGVAVVARVPFAGSLGTMLTAGLNATPTARSATVLEVWGPGEAVAVAGDTTRYEPARLWVADDGSAALDAALKGVAA